MCNGWIVHKQKNIGNPFYSKEIPMFFSVGMTGLEPATTRPPDVYANQLRYIPYFS